MRIRKSYICILLLVNIACYAQQSLRFKRKSVQHGLSQNTVTKICQDRHGFIWLGTQDGLNRYDGSVFTIYRNIENDSTSLTNNYVISLTADSSGNIWVGTTNGLNRIDADHGLIERIALKHILPNATNYRVFAICPAQNGFVYFSTAYGVFYADSNNKVHAVPGLDEASKTGTEMLEHNGQLWIGGQTGLRCYDIKSGRVKEMLPAGEIALLAVRGPLVYLKKKSLLYTFNHQSGSLIQIFHHYIDSTRNTVSVFADVNEIWISTERGLIWQQGRDTMVLNYISEYEQSLSSDFVYCVFKDRSGLYWIGTSRGGVCLFNPRGQDFKILGKGNGLSEAVWGITTLGDTLVLTTSKGVRFYLKNKNISRLSKTYLPESALREFSIKEIQQPLQSSLVSSVCRDRHNNLWFGTEQQGIYCFNLKNKTVFAFKSIANDSGTIISDHILHLASLSDSTIGVASPQGFCIINTRTKKVKRYNLPKLNPQIPNNYLLKSFAIGDVVWLSTSNGACALNLKTNTLKQYLPDEKHPEEQYHNIISDIKTDRNGRLWVATLGYGLLTLDASSGKFERHSAADGLKNESPLGILVDDYNNVWTGTHDGLSKFDQATRKFQNYSVSEGLDSKEFTVNGFYKDDSGDLYFGTVSGLVVFDPGNIKPVNNICATVLSDLKINYKKVSGNNPYIRKGSLAIPEVLSLEPDVKTISFEFAAINFLNHEDISYQYKLHGFNNEWVTTRTERSAIYTNLPAGQYTFEVMPLLYNSKVKEAALRFLIVVSPPFWQTWWFISIAVSLFILIIIGIIRAYYMVEYRKQLKKAEEEMRMQKEKERISRELHDNVGTQLTYIIKSLDNLSYKSGKETAPMTSQLDALGDYSRDTLNQLRESIWAINSRVILLSELINKIVDYCEKINSGLGDTGVQFEHSYTSDTELKPTFAINIFRIIQEAVMNSLKYAEADYVRVLLSQQKNGMFELLIMDNGRGFELSEKTSKGYGLANMKARAEELGGHLDISSNQGKGTHVKMVLFKE